MGDIDEGGSFFFQLSDDAEQDFRLLLGQGGGGLVQDQNFQIQHSSFGDLHNLHHRGGQHAHRVLRVDIQLKGVKKFLASPQHLLIVHDDSPAGVIAHEHVLHDGQIRHQVELLIDCADAAFPGLAGQDGGVLLIEQRYGARRGHVRSRQTLDESGFSGPVFSQEGENLALLECKTDIMQRTDAGK